MLVIRQTIYLKNFCYWSTDRFGSTVVVGKLLYFVQKIELLYFMLYQTVCMTVMVVWKNWPHVFLVIIEYNDLWTAESW